MGLGWVSGFLGFKEDLGSSGFGFCGSGFRVQGRSMPWGLGWCLRFQGFCRVSSLGFMAWGVQGFRASFGVLVQGLPGFRGLEI